jgi:hypothetical protein
MLTDLGRKSYLAPGIALVTKVETLAMRMLTEGKAAPGGIHVIPARDIWGPVAAK